MSRLTSGLAQGRNLARGLILLAACVFAGGIHLWANPPTPPFTQRRLGWVVELVHLILGPTGPALLTLLASAGLIVFARSVWRHTPKRPGDRLF